MGNMWAKKDQQSYKDRRKSVLKNFPVQFGLTCVRKKPNGSFEFKPFNFNILPCNSKSVSLDVD